MNKLPARLIGLKAVISDCTKYRYWLSRQLSDTSPIKPIVFVMLNPSTADHCDDDNTITRCIDYAKRWGGTELIVVNLFSYRSTDPDALWHSSTIDPVGHLTDDAIAIAADYAHAHGGIVCCAWGNDGQFMNRGMEVLSKIIQYKPLCLKLNATGMPAHPLYQKKTAELKEMLINNLQR